MNFLKSILLMAILSFSSENFHAQDWANLKRYQNENAELMKQNSNEKRIVFMGNSITESWISNRPGFFKGKPYVNRGIGGQTTPQMLLRFKQDVIELHPYAVVILAGINDIAGNTGPITIEETFQNIVAMAEMATSNGIKVILCSVLPAKDFPWRPGLEPAEKVVKLNALLKKYANINNLVYVDYFSEMNDGANGLRENLGYDGVHPNTLGYSIMEPLVEEGIAKALKNK
jgi:lysophospholipase L1-like esterase